METENYANALHIGRKIERIRRLRGMTQTDLGDLLGVTKQAISKMEQNEKIEDDKLKQVAGALGVTEDGLKKFTEETVLYYTSNFYENCHVSASNIGPITTVENLNHFSIDQAVKLFEELLKIEREKYKKEKDEDRRSEASASAFATKSFPWLCLPINKLKGDSSESTTRTQ